MSREDTMPAERAALAPAAMRTFAAVEELRVTEPVATPLAEPVGGAGHLVAAAGAPSRVRTGALAATMAVVVQVRPGTALLNRVVRVRRVF
jgi:hypothetical protein